MSGRKRKASDEPEDRMSTSPASSPPISSSVLPTPIQSRRKRTRTSLTTGRPLDLPRLLETLEASDLRSILTEICNQHPSLASDIVSRAPRPNLESTLSVLHKYQTVFKEAFPFGNRPTSDYTYNRVRAPMHALLEALKDYTPHFLPPQESQASNSLTYLDAVTSIVHDLPDWDTYSHNAVKYETYEELDRTWSAVIKEAMKRGGGIQLQFGGWDQKVLKHDEMSGGRLQGAVDELRRGLGWFGAPRTAPAMVAVGSGSGISNDERAQIRQQLFSGTYGAQVGVGNGHW